VLGGGRLQGDSGQLGKLPGELCYKLRTTIGCDCFGGSINPPNVHKIQICQFSGRAGLSGKEAERPFSQTVDHHQDGVITVLVRGKGLEIHGNVLPYTLGDWQRLK
jgi:hypothetical protein